MLTIPAILPVKSNKNRDLDPVYKEKIKKSLKIFNETEKGKNNRKKTSERMSNRIVSEETRKKIGKKSKERCESLEVRRFMGKIGMNSSSWGFTGYTFTGRFYQSNFEKKCFDFLDQNNIEFEDHKYLPKSSKICDIYISKFDIWIELDGIGRERRQQFLISKYGNHIDNYWQSKLKEYEDKKLKFEIFTCLSDLKIYINAPFA